MKRKLLFVFLGLFLLLVFFLFGTQKGYDLRIFAAQTILSTQHRELAKWTFLPKEELDKILDNIQNPKYSNTIIAPNIEDESLEGDNITKTKVRYPSEKDELIVEVETIEVKNSSTYYYKGKVMTISNPYNVQLKSSSSENYGEQIFVIAEKVGAVAATNASGFYDPSGRGNGGTSLGIVIEDGIIKNNNAGKQGFAAGITSKGHLLTGKYFADELLELDVQDAAGFKPQLIANGKKMITEGDGGWGAGPRTAIGQTKDGKIILVVIDGRQVHSLGATIKDVQDILYDRGAINALAMDGGSSASMYLNGSNITTPSSLGNIPRYLPNIWAVIPKEGQSVKVVYDGEVIIEKEKYKK